MILVNGTAGTNGRAVVDRPLAAGESVRRRVDTAFT